jgi:hypothetical protein
MAQLSLVFDLLARDNASKAFRDVGNAAALAVHGLTLPPPYTGRVG